MEETKSMECPQIRYHITYDKNLTFKDFEDLLHIIRISNNDVLYKMGIPKHKANGLQKIEQIEPGSIEIIIEKIKEIFDTVNDAATVMSVIKFVYESVNTILDKIRIRREKPARNPREDRKVYDKYEVKVELKERSNTLGENVTIYVIHIHICNRNTIDL